MGVFFFCFVLFHSSYLILKVGAQRENSLNLPLCLLATERVGGKLPRKEKKVGKNESCSKLFGEHWIDKKNL